MGNNQKPAVATEQGALAVRKLTFWEAALIIVGANIGSGILGLAYSSLHHCFDALCCRNHPSYQKADAAPWLGRTLCR